MRRKTFILLLITISSSFLALSQNIEYSLSENYKVKSKYSHMFLLDDIDDSKSFMTIYKNYSYLLRLEGKSRFINKRIKNPFDEIESYKLHVSMDTIWTAVLAKHKKKKELSLNVIRYDKNGQEIDRVLLQKLKNEDYKKPPKLSFLISKDETKLSLVIVSDRDHKKEAFKIKGYVFSQNKKLLNEIEYIIKTPEAQKLTQLSNLTITNSGELLLVLKKHFDSKPTRKKGKEIPNYNYDILSFDLSGEKVVSKLDLIGNIIYSSDLYLTENENPILVLDCREESDSNLRTSGMITYVRDTRNGKWISHYKNFSTNDYYDMFLDDSSINNNYSFKSNYVTVGDKLFLLYERVLKKSKNFLVTSHTGFSSATISLHSNALVFTIDKQGQFIDHVFIPKFYETGETEIGSRLVRHNDSSALIYGNRTSNFDKTLEDYKKFDNNQALKKPQVIMAAYVNNDELVMDYIEDSENWDISLKYLTQSVESQSIVLPVFNSSYLTTKIRLLKFGL